MLDATLVDELRVFERLVPEWDALAVETGAPTSTPAWMLGWWRHAAPAGAALCAVVVREDGRLVGLAPFWRDAARLSFLAGGSFSSSVSLLAAPGRERDVAAAVARALAASRPRPDLLEAGPALVSALWPTALRAGWPTRARPLALRAEAVASPVIDLGEGDFEAWLASRRPSFRKSLRRRTRAFLEAGGAFRQCTAETLDEDIAAFVRLHSARWRTLGSSRMVAMGQSLPLMLRDVARELGPGDRFRLHLLEAENRAIAAAVSIEAGGEVAAINTGWDEDYRQLAPLQLLQVWAVEDSFARGDRRIGLGRGVSEAKLAVADDDEPVVEAMLVPLGARTPAALIEGRAFVRRCAQERVRAALPESIYDRLRSAKRRLTGRGPAGSTRQRRASEAPP